MVKIYKKELFNKLPDAILIDMDDTLYAYAPAHKAAMDAVRKKVTHTFSISPHAFEEAYSEAKKRVKAQLQHTASSHNRLLYFQNMLEVIGLGSQVMWALDFEQTYWSTFLSRAVLFDNVKELLDDLRLQGIPTAIVTDLTAQIQFRKVIYFGLDHYIDYIVTSEEAGQDKPAAAPFKLALNKIQPKGETIWMLGESVAKDIIGARQQIGAITLQKLHEGIALGTGDGAPDASFKQFDELRQLIASLAEKA